VCPASTVRAATCLLGLFSVVTLAANRLHRQGDLLTRKAAWYDKAELTFSDAIAAVRHHLWRQQTFFMSAPETERLKIPRPA
jgi:hypothetical protein